MHKGFLFIYYVLISKLPHSRLSKGSNLVRVLFCSKLLRIMPFDKLSKFENNIYISTAKKIKIGKCCRINENVLIQGEVDIGDYVMIAPNVAIHSTTHIYDDPEVPMVLNGLTIPQKVIIGDNIWIGRNCVILPGVRIGSGSIIGANSVVTKDIAEYSICGGVPAKLIKMRK